VPVFDRTVGNPREALVREAAAFYTSHGCDGVVGLGGGSSLDLAKAVALATTHPGPLKHYAFIEGGAKNITPAVAPVIAVPTTAGTGSEVGRAAVIILDDGRKVAIISPHMIPESAICDPELTFGLPPHLTGATGMDALTHCVETFLAPAFNPPADGIALDGLRRGWNAIQLAFSQPDSRLARRDMMSASMQGALAFQKGLGAVHSLSHAIGGLHPELHHGQLNAILLPPVIRFNATAKSVKDDRKIERLAETIGVPCSVKAVADAVGNLTQRLGLETRLRDFGISRAEFPMIIDRAVQDHCHATNPREASPVDYDRLLNAAL
jgi:alcohol dehydrogenase class IV